MPLPLLLLLLWLRNATSGLPADTMYTRVQHLEGETLSVQCHYNHHKNQGDGKVWCKIKKNKCDTKFTRAWAQKPHYLLQDDAQAKVVTITMVALRRQDSGRYWCMRNSSKTLYPVMGIQLEVSPAPRKRLSNILKSGIDLTTKQVPTTDPDEPLTTGMTLFTPGFLTLPRPLPSTATESIEPTPTTKQRFTKATLTIRGSRKIMRSQTVTESPSRAQASSAGPPCISPKTGTLSTRSSSTGMWHTSRSDLNRLPPNRHQDFDPTVFTAVVASLPVPVLLVIFYGLWKRRHVGRYSVYDGHARPWRDTPRPEPPWKLTWSETT